MTLYELLRELVKHSGIVNEGTRRDAVALIDELETVQAFGTLTARMEGVDHAHVPVYNTWRDSQVANALGDYHRQEYCQTCGAILGPVQTLIGQGRYGTGEWL